MSPADEDTAGTPSGCAGPPALLTLTQVGDGPDVRHAGIKAVLLPDCLRLMHSHTKMCKIQTQSNQTGLNVEQTDWEIQTCMQACHLT